MQPAKASFMEYFEQKEKEANSHNDAGGGGRENNKQATEGDLEVVSTVQYSTGCRSWLMDSLSDNQVVSGNPLTT